MAGSHRIVRARTGLLRAPWFRLAVRLGLVASDAALVWLSFLIAHILRYQFELGGPVQPWDDQPFSTFAGRAQLFAALTVAVFFVRGLYRLPRTTALLDEAVVVAGGVTTAMAGVILTAFLTRFVPSRLVFIFAWAIAIGLLILRRGVARWVRDWLWSKDLNVDRVVVIGAGDSGRRLMQAMMGMPGLGYKLVGFVDDAVNASPMPIATESRMQRAERLGEIGDLDAIVSERDIDQVIIALPGDDHERVFAIVERCRKLMVEFKVVPDLLQLSLDRVDLGEVAGVPLIGMKDFSIRGGNYVIKRSLDLLIAGIILVVMAIPMAVIALWVKLDSPGPVLYRQTRVGKNGKAFTILKFRCMVQNADELRASLIAQHPDLDFRLFKLKHDPRLTRAGKWLRRISLDELPQFVQVLKGEMSIVGPRPQLVEEVAGYEEWHKQRLLVTPGVTGLWQINGRSQLNFDDMVRLDLYYAEHWSPWLDVKIMLRTAPAVIAGRGAY
jgi:exopolysaccharide biosynthesis polyprenyl glycosylphosphotransferase